MLNAFFALTIVRRLNNLKVGIMFISPPACLVPGAGLGRLALEISCLGMHVNCHFSILYLIVYKINHG